MICIYHSRDLDGWMSAAIIKLKYPDVKLVGWDYGQPLPELNPESEDQIILVDISFPPETMRQLGYVFNVTWIDHHASAIKDSEINAYTIYLGLRDSLFAACELTWQYLFPEQSIPEIVRLLGRYDCFGHKGTDEELKVLEFQYGARTLIRNPDEALRYLLDTHDYGDGITIVDKIHEIGKAIYQYLCSEAKQIYARKFDMLWGDKIIAMVNQERFNPINFRIDYHKDGYDAFGCFHFAKGRWMFSLYNDNGNVDVSELCKQQGGGGHKGAAGFVKEDISWAFQYVVNPK